MTILDALPYMMAGKPARCLDWDRPSGTVLTAHQGAVTLLLQTGKGTDAVYEPYAPTKLELLSDNWMFI